MTQKVRRALALEGTDIVLELKTVATPKTPTEFIYIDKLPDGAWRLAFNVKGVCIQDVQALRMIREDGDLWTQVDIDNELKRIHEDIREFDYVGYEVTEEYDKDRITLDGRFNLAQLKALVKLMENVQSAPTP